MKISKKGLTYILLLCSIVTSCDCMQRIQAVVVDAETGRPIQGVRMWCKGADPQYARLTDSVGYAAESHIKGGFSCPPMKVIVAKKGYQTKKVKSVGHNDTTLVQLERLHQSQ